VDSHRSSFGKAHEEALQKDLLRKYAAVSLALGMTRDTLHSVLMSDATPEIKHMLDLTSTSEIAKKLGLEEAISSLSRRLSDGRRKRTHQRLLTSFLCVFGIHPILLQRPHPRHRRRDA